MKDFFKWFAIMWLINGLLMCAILRFYPQNRPLSIGQYAILMVVWPVAAQIVLEHVIEDVRF